MSYEKYNFGGFDAPAVDADLQRGQSFGPQFPGITYIGDPGTTSNGNGFFVIEKERVPEGVSAPYDWEDDTHQFGRDPNAPHQDVWKAKGLTERSTK